MTSKAQKIIDALANIDSLQGEEKLFKSLRKELEKLDFRLKRTHSESENFQSILKRTVSDYEEALDTQKMFIANISHEMRTPLNGIIGYGKLLEDSPLNTEQEEFLGYLNNSSNHLLVLVNDVLDVSKIEANQLEMIPKEINLAHELQHVAKMLKTNLHPNVSLVLDLPAQEHFVYGDATRIKQIFLNLLSNAIKFTDEGEIHFYIDAITPVGKNKEQFTVVIKDSGMGIPASKIHSLFSPFKQAHDSNHGGTGLGLYISQRIAKQLHGGIEVSSIEDEGSTFSVHFVLDKSSKIISTKEQSPTIPQKVHNTSHNAKILVVDDVEMNVTLLRTMIRRHYGIESDSASNGKEAVEKIKQTPYNMVFMDIQMPLMDGLEASRVIRTFNKHVPIVALSGNVFKEDIDAAFDAGMNDFLQKPIALDKLIQSLDKCLKNG